MYLEASATERRCGVAVSCQWVHYCPSFTLPFPPRPPCRYHKPGLHGFLLSAGWKGGDGLRGPSHPHPIYSLIALESRTAARPSTRAIRVYQCSLPSVCKHASLSKHRTTGGKSPHILFIVILSPSRGIVWISKGWDLPHLFPSHILCHAILYKPTQFRKRGLYVLPKDNIRGQVNEVLQLYKITEFLDQPTNWTVQGKQCTLGLKVIISQ